MTPLAGLLFILAFAAPAVARRVGGDPFAPAALVVLTWAASIALCLLTLLPYGTVSVGTWVFVAGAIAALIAGMAVGSALFGWLGRTGAAPDSARHATARHDAVVHARWVATFAALGLGGVAWYAAAVVGLLGWRGFADGERLRQSLTTYAIPSTFLLSQFFCLVAPLVAAALTFAGRRLPLGVRLLAAAAAAGTLVTTDRTQAFTLVLSLAFMWMFARGRALPVRRLLAVGAIVPAILAANFVAVDAWRRNVLQVFEVKLTIEGPDSRATPLRAAFWRRATSAYYYATSSYPALDRLLADPGPRTGGALSLYPAVRVLERTGLAGPAPPYIPGFVTVTAPGQDPPAYSNAYTYLYYPLRDFGRGGAAVYSAVLGLACGLAWAWARQDRRSPARLLVAGQISTAIAFLPLFNKFNNTAWWYVLVWTLAPFAYGAWRGRARAQR